ncbi:MAG: hypothetical protein LJU34_06045 [Oscillospiraceae bacterium]|nr:hypothetical protein [Oscillospiraceae bacterium]
MGIYIGYIEKIGYDKVFFNFKPIAIIKGQQIDPLSSADLDELLPESEKRNINFAFSWNDADAQQQIDSLFGDGSLVIFEFETSELQPNFKATGERNQTGYKVSVCEQIDIGKIRRLDNAGIYYAIRANELLSDFYNDAIVEIDSSFIVQGDCVFVELDDFWAGPYVVGYRDFTSSYYIKPQIKENKYTVSGYKKSNMALREFTSSERYWGVPENRWMVVIPKKDTDAEQFDVITDELLLDGFRDSLSNSAMSAGKVNLEDVRGLLQRYEESTLTGSVLTREVQKNRLNRLVSILTSEEDVDETLGTIADFICDLLLKYQNSPNVEEWLQELLKKHPELLEQLKGTQAISERIVQLEQNLLDMQQQEKVLTKELSEKKAEIEKVSEATIQASKDEMLRSMSEEHTALSKQLADDTVRLEELKEKLELAEGIAELQKKESELQAHYDYLSGATANLEAEIQQIITRTREKMLNIAFDGFMSSKMLQAAAQWESEETDKQNKTRIHDVDAIPAPDKEPKELVDYLIRTIRIVRPNYSRNTIVNIAICMTQSFLTVFSGEPGCGKTSICNIFGDALGLNKIATAFGDDVGIDDTGKRYISVSVERGWTSKRDFVGYYNPLSKTFDKSNRRIYDALCQLDAEKRLGKKTFPFIIMLDEANLSPMEYYWSDFMNICDDLWPESKVNLGENHVFCIPETLHFLATINNDHTTETLSPRLVDRAWIITLPQQYNTTASESVIPVENIEYIPWKSLCNAFIPQKDECVLSSEIQRVYEAVVTKLREKRFSVSARVDKAIKRYWATASKYFDEDETKTSAEVVALDYAICQRILPKITGNGREFEKWLDEFRNLCSNNELSMSAKMLKDIIDRGKQQMNYYQFFC